MDGLDLNRLALIVSERVDANRKTTYVFGTGYFLSAQLVLTASHVIPEHPARIRVRAEGDSVFRDVDPSERGLEPVWRDTHLDAALLRVPSGLPKTVPITWMEDLPRDDVSWSSSGYPIAAAIIDKQMLYKTAGLRGVLYATGGVGQGVRELDLGVESGAVVDGWHGISGAPVFIEGKLAGIVTQVPDDFRGGRLRALPASVLLSRAAFREALELDWLAWPSHRPWVLVLQADGGDGTLATKAKTALTIFNANYLAVTGGPPFQVEPLVVRIQDAISRPERWLRLVKALCEAPVLIADVTSFQPAVMLALGVRAVVRRAVTITSTAEEFSETHLAELPFNIRETKLICHGGRFEPQNPQHPVNVISRAIRDGLLESRMHSRYLDLPAYDHVRCPLPGSTAGLQAARESVLVLCSFQPDYSENWKALSDKILDYCAPKLPVRMLDLSSPRLVGQALYEYIRWAETCIVDWSGFRPNVFFELGVRLACSGSGAMSLVQVNEAAVPEGSQKQMLFDLFRPVKYDRDKPDDTLRDAFEEYVRDAAGKVDGIPITALPHDATYQMAMASFVWERDHSIELPDKLLRASIEEEFGKDPQRSGVPIVLFSVNKIFEERVRLSMQERWIAAWYYMTCRYREKIKTDLELRRELKELGENVLLWIPADTKDAHLKGLLEEVLAYIDSYDEVTGAN